MEKHIEIFCEQNPVFEVTCQNCNTKNKIPMKNLLKTKYSYTMTCENCRKTTEIDTHSFYKELNKLKSL